MMFLMGFFVGIVCYAGVRAAAIWYEEKDSGWDNEG